jgi:hypothetical protein
LSLQHLPTIDFDLLSTGQHFNMALNLEKQLLFVSSRPHPNVLLTMGQWLTFRSMELITITPYSGPPCATVMPQHWTDEIN